MKVQPKCRRFLLIVFLCATSASAKETNEINMIRQDGDILYYQIRSNRVVFAEQYQLFGAIENFRTNATHAMFAFSGDVRINISGEQWGVTPGTNSKCFKWHVRNLLVKISRWKEGDTVPWGSVPITFEQFTLKARELVDRNERVQIALHLPKFVFTDIGDLFYIEAEQVVLKRSAVPTNITTELTPHSVAVAAQPRIHTAFDPKRAEEIVKGNVLPQMIEKVAIYNKFIDSGPNDRLDVAAVIDQVVDITSLISAIKESRVPPEPKDPNIKAGNWWGYEFRFLCKDHNNAVLSVFVFDGYYEMIGHSTPGERYGALVHQDNEEPPSHKSSFFTQNLNIGEWLKAHSLPFREGTRRGIGTTDADETRVK